MMLYYQSAKRPSNYVKFKKVLHHLKNIKLNNVVLKVHRVLFLHDYVTRMHHTLSFRDILQYPQ